MWSIENAENKKINCDIRPIESNKGSNIAFSKALNLFQTILGALRTNFIPFITAKNLIFVEISKFFHISKIRTELEIDYEYEYEPFLYRVHSKQEKFYFLYLVIMFLQNSNTSIQS